jgi:hypothetical protein
MIRDRNTIALLQKIRFYKIKFIVYPNTNNNLRNNNVTLRTVHIIFKYTWLLQETSVTRVTPFQGTFEIMY